MILMLAIMALLLLGAILFFIASPKSIAPNSSISCPTISVIIAARNEAQRIRPLLESLRTNDYLEIIVIDDHSEDSTAFVVSQFEVNYLKLEHASGKKAAIEYGVKAAKGEFILQLDADVVVGNSHGQALQSYVSSSIDMLILPLSIEQDGSMLKEIQGIEQTMLCGLSSAMSKPINANGAHLLYRKEAFDSVGGFEGNRQWASGDDSFLVNAFLKNGRIVKHVFDSKLTVLVKAAPTWTGFFLQRIRWAGKVRAMWSLLQLVPWVIVLLILYQFFIVTLLSPILLLSAFGTVVFCCLLLWYVAQLTFYNQVQQKLNRNSTVFHVIIASIFFSLYAPSLAILSIFVKPSWKGRRI